MSVSINDYDFRNALELDKKILSFAGLYPIGKPAKRTLVQTISGFVSVFLMIAVLLSMMAQIVVYRHNMFKVLETLLLLLAEITYFGKVVNLAYYSDGVLDLEKRLTNSLFYGFPCEQLAKMHKRIKTCYVIAFIFKSLAGMCWLFFGLVVIIDKKKRLAFPGWLPFDHNKYYYQTTLFQTVAIFSSAINNTTLDTLIWMFITLGTVQFEILKDKMKNMDFGSGEQSKKDEFKRCIEHHKAIIELVSQIEHNFSKCIFVQFLASGSIICFTCFQFLFIPIPSAIFIHLLLYLSVMISQIGMYCWYGNEIIVKSSEIGTFLYMSNWYKSDLETRKLMVVFMERSKRPMMLTAGNLIILSVVTLSSILRSSYSFLAVLRRWYQNK